MSNPKSQNFSNLLHSDEPQRESEGPSKWQQAVATLGSIANEATDSIARNMKIAGSDFVTRVMEGHGYSPAEQQPDHQPDPAKDDRGMDR